MDEFVAEDYDDAPEQDEEELLDQEDVVEEVEQSEQQRAEAADLAKLFRQHPEIWIPYSDQVQEQLNIKAPDAESDATTNVSLRDLKALDAHHSTYPFLTSYERTKCISFRASQIAHGAKPYMLVPEGMNDAYEIAKMELEAKRLPYIIKRPLPDGSFEVWRLTDLVVF